MMLFIRMSALAILLLCSFRAIRACRAIFKYLRQSNGHNRSLCFFIVIIEALRILESNFCWFLISKTPKGLIGLYIR